MILICTPSRWPCLDRHNQPCTVQIRWTPPRSNLQNFRKPLCHHRCSKSPRDKSPVLLPFPLRGCHMCLRRSICSEGLLEAPHWPHKMLLSGTACPQWHLQCKIHQSHIPCTLTAHWCPGTSLPGSGHRALTRQGWDEKNLAHILGKHQTRHTCCTGQRRSSGKHFLLLAWSDPEICWPRRARMRLCQFRFAIYPPDLCERLR